MSVAEVSGGPLLTKLPPAERSACGTLTAVGATSRDFPVVRQAQLTGSEDAELQAYIRITARLRTHSELRRACWRFSMLTSPRHGKRGPWVEEFSLVSWH